MLIEETMGLGTCVSSLLSSVSQDLERCWSNFRSTWVSRENVYRSLYRNILWDGSTPNAVSHKPDSCFLPLGSMRYFDRAALFVEACLMYGAMEVGEDTDILCWVVMLRRKQMNKWV